MYFSSMQLFQKWFNQTTVGVIEWTSNCIPLFYVDVINYPSASPGASSADLC